MKNRCLLNQCPSIQKGLTLIEMMMALTLGLFVIASILQIFASTKQTYLLEEQNSRLQENGRFALDFLSRYIRMAGYRENRPVTPDTRLPLPQDAAFPKTPENVDVFTGGDGQVLAGFDTDPNFNNIASVTFRYQGSSDGVIDCFGRSVLNSQMVTNTFFLAPTDPNNPANDMSLSCQSTILPASSAPGPWRYPLMPGIADMQILYGVQVSAGGTIQEQYMNATNLNAQPSLWNNVVSVRIALLLQSDNNITTQPQTYRFPPWNTVNTTATDLRWRQVFSTTINIRNPKIGL